jgi:hypothetical protein
MTKLQIAIGSLLLVAASTFLNLLITSNMLEREIAVVRHHSQVLFINPDHVLKIFVEERTEGWETDQIADAMKPLDAIWRDEANLLHRETGFPILNGRHVLVGGNDVSEQFAQRVLKRWDERNGQ